MKRVVCRVWGQEGGNGSRPQHFQSQSQSIDKCSQEHEIPQSSSRPYFVYIVCSRIRIVSPLVPKIRIPHRIVLSSRQRLIIIHSCTCCWLIPTSPAHCVGRLIPSMTLRPIPTMWRFVVSFVILDVEWLALMQHAWEHNTQLTFHFLASISFLVSNDQTWRWDVI